VTAFGGAQRDGNNGVSMTEEPRKPVLSGLKALDHVIKGLRLGDNVVWQVDDLKDYSHFAEPFAEQAIKSTGTCVYIRFAPHPPILRPRRGLAVTEVDPKPGFDVFSAQIHRVIEEWGSETLFVFDNISFLAEEWTTDELLANFFQVTCPFLYEMDTVAYFALTRGKHAHSAIARIRDTTQVLIDVYRLKNRMYIHPLKVWDRYSPQMFLPHEVSNGIYEPVFQSGQAAAVSATARRFPLRAKQSSIAPWDSIYSRLEQYDLEKGIDPERESEFQALKQEFTRMMLGWNPRFNRLADRYFELEDLYAIRNRMIGTGRIGGKAAGMLVARRILLKSRGKTSFSDVMEDHDSFYIGSDVFFTFLVQNNLFRLRLKLSRNSDTSHEEFEQVEKNFLKGNFPQAIMEEFEGMLEYFGQAPIIVRSSSLQEDSFGNAFAGKYRSEFCPNQGTLDERLKAFLTAVKLVYASALSPDALSYRRRRGLGERDEQMAILVQRVSGMPYRNFFFPSLAGVAFSKNRYAWTHRIDSGRGVIRLVFGLGTRAVNRVGDDYPRMIAVSHPGLRPETGMEIAKYSQRKIDLLDLVENSFETLPIGEVLSGGNYPNLHMLISILKDGYMTEPFKTLGPDSGEKLILTFNRLIGNTDFIRIMDEALQRLEHAYGQPVDTEFTASIDKDGKVRVNILQCRPLLLPGLTGPVKLPQKLNAERILFKSKRFISGGMIERVRYIIFISPYSYSGVGNPDLKKSVGRIVGRLNRNPKIIEGKALLIGPGRWGSSNIDLGVNVSYADIDNMAALVEIAGEDRGHVPEVSYGTHFFQDLVEARIIYLPLYPDEPDSMFNAGFFDKSVNRIRDFTAHYEGLEGVVKVIDVPETTGGAYAGVVADPQTHTAICFLEKN